MHVREHIPLGPYTTFKIGGPARFFAGIASEDDLPAAVAFARERDLRLFILGGGSNLLVPDAGFDGLVLRIAIAGLQVTSTGLLTAGAGVPWEDTVNAALAQNLAGIECLAGIPGSTGGTPVQNVGAYGQEVASTITSVRAFDLHTNAFVTLTRAACNFRYRASLFNTDEPGRYIVTRVTFQLTPGGAPILTYADLKNHFAAASHPATLIQVAEAVRSIRRAKGMLIDPAHPDPDTRSAGSYFKNPIIAASTLAHIAAATGLTPDAVPHWPAGEKCIKLPAAWLLDQSGIHKGFALGRAAISSCHTLALTNPGHATFADIAALESHIVAAVHARFGINLEREPVLLT